MELCARASILSASRAFFNSVVRNAVDQTRAHLESQPAAAARSYLSSPTVFLLAHVFITSISL